MLKPPASVPKTLLQAYVCTMNSEHAAVHRAPAADGLCWDQGHSHTGARDDLYSLIPSVVKLTLAFFVHIPQVLEVS